MTKPSCSLTARKSRIVSAALALSLVASIQPASAENFFQALFGGFHRRAPQAQQQTSSFPDPLGIFGTQQPQEASGFGHGTVYCVRTCDGRYFPLQNHSNASPAEMCRAFCPAAKTMVFSGSKIDTAVAPSGQRYADLDTAFAYRDKVTSNCSCNGKDGLGLARVDVSNDPTLRPGDIVATDQGLSTYTGNRSKGAEFTPINTSSGEWARRLSEMKVDPAPPADKIEPVPDDNTAAIRRTRAQAAR